MWPSASDHRPGLRVLDVTSVDRLLELADVSSDCNVSLYLPTHHAGREVTQDRVRLKNLIGAAGAEIDRAGRVRSDELLAPARALLDDHDFWAHGASGLAVLVDRRGTLVVRLPDAVHELAVVADRFHLKPLIATSSGEHEFHVLALSLGAARLLRGTRTAVRPVAVDGLPQGMDDALRWDDRERQLQSHGATRVGRGQVAAAFHGQGGSKDVHDADVGRYLRVIDHALVGHLGPSTAPLVLAGVAELVAEFRRTTRLRHVVDETVTGNPDSLTDLQLHDRAWPLVRPVLDAPRREAAEQLYTGRAPIVGSVTAAVDAASAGRVGTLFVPADEERWGRRDGDRVIEHDVREPGDVDLCDLAAADTMRHRGRVYAVPRAEIPGGGQVAASLRF